MLPIPFSALLLCLTGCQQDFLQPQKGDLMNPPKLFDTRQEYGHIQTATTIVPSTADIFLAGAADGVVLRHPNGQEDVAPDNSPVRILENVINGGETLDIYASGKARHLPLRAIEFGPRGWMSSPLIEAGPAMGYRSIQGAIGSLIGLFDNQPAPVLIGQRRQVEVPRGANSLYLAMLDYPGASSDNQGEYFVTIYVLRR
jgi:hypothetical protein